MRLQVQLKPQCLAFAFAMALDIEVRTLIKLVGHNGLHVIWPSSPPPRCFRGFHHQEMIDAAMKLGHSVVMIEAYPALGNGGEAKCVYTHQQMRNRMRHYLDRYTGVLTTSTHAVAWDHTTQRCYDPNGRIYELGELEIREYFIIIRGTHGKEEGI